MDLGAIRPRAQCERHLGGHGPLLKGFMSGLLSRLVGQRDADPGW